MQAKNSIHIAAPNKATKQSRDLIVCYVLFTILRSPEQDLNAQGTKACVLLG